MLFFLGASASGDTGQRDGEAEPTISLLLFWPGVCDIACVRAVHGNGVYQSGGGVECVCYSAADWRGAKVRGAAQEAFSEYISDSMRFSFQRPGVAKIDTPNGVSDLSTGVIETIFRVNSCQALLKIASYQNAASEDEAD